MMKVESQSHTRIELLSPSNKPTYKHYDQYIAKRDDTHRSGLRLVEIDYLHNTRPIIPDIPSYKDRQDHGHPYMILVGDPRPTLKKGRTLVYDFGVIDTLPILDIPLKGKDFVRFNFDDVYNTTFESSRAFSQIFSDANKTPRDFKAYTNDDQKMIQKRTASQSKG